MPAPKEIIVDFTEKGAVEAMHHDEFDLSFLGRKVVQRATEIFHDSDTDKWYILLPTQIEKQEASASVCDFSTYESARTFEVLWFNECRKRHVEPGSHDGAVVALELRVKYWE